MKIQKLGVLLCFLFAGCCQDEIVASYRFSTFEQTLIPYTSFLEIPFIDNEGNTFMASSQPKENRIGLDRAGPESCRLTEVEEELNFLSFQSKDLLIKLELIADTVSYFSLSVTSSNAPTNNGRFDISCEGLFDLTIEERLTDVSIGEFVFQNVLVFEDCSKNSAIKTIIYSASNGVEFIEFSNGDWFKLIIE